MIRQIQRNGNGLRSIQIDRFSCVFELLSFRRRQMRWQRERAFNE